MQIASQAVRRRLIALAAGMLAVPLGATVAASPSRASSEPRDVYFSADADWQVGQQVSIGELKEAGVSDAEIFDGAGGQPSAGADPGWSTQLGRGDWAIEKIWYDKNGRGVVLRSGNSGWGWAHMYQKHNMTSKTAQRTTKGYDAYILTGGTSYRYALRDFWVECRASSGCNVRDRRDLYVVHERKVLSDGHFRGIISGYCSPQPDPKHEETKSKVCPHWVNRN